MLGLIRRPFGQCGVLCLALLAFCFLMALGAVKSFASEDVTGAAMPSFSLKMIDGQLVELSPSEEEGVVGVVFFALWSPNSAKVLAEVEKAQTEFSDQGFVAVAVSAEGEQLDANYQQQLTQYITDNNITLPVVLDEGLVTYRAWGIKAIPTTYIVNSKLEVIALLPGAPSSYPDDLRDAIKQGLGIATEAEAVADKGPTRYRPEKALTLQFGMALKTAERGRTSKALRQIDKVVAADPKFTEAKTLQGMLLLTQAEKDVEASHAARAAFEEALALDPTMPHALLGLAHFQMLDGANDKASESIKTALAQEDWGLFGKPDEEALAQANASLEAADETMTSSVDSFLTLRIKKKVQMNVPDRQAAEGQAVQ